MMDETFLDEIVALFGAAFEGSEVDRFLDKWGFDRSFDPDMYPYRYIEARERGISLQFAYEDKGDGEEYPTFCGIFFYDGGVDGYAKFSGVLPCGIDFDDRREQVRERLGRPSFSGPRLDRWDSEALSLAVDYSRDPGEPVIMVNLATKFES